MAKLLPEIFLFGSHYIILDFTSFFSIKIFNFYKHHQYISKKRANFIFCREKSKFNNNACQILTAISKIEQVLLISVLPPVHAKVPYTLLHDYSQYANVFADNLLRLFLLILQFLQLPEIHMYLPGK